MSMSQGGSFFEGFAANSVGGIAGYSTQGIGGPDGIYARTAIAATASGLASEITGGKFSNGAVTAAFVHLYNQEAHSASESVQEKIDRIVRIEIIWNTSPIWNRRAEGKSKCNYFVCDMANAADIDVSFINGRWSFLNSSWAEDPPSVSQCGNANFNIKWFKVVDGANLRPGVIGSSGRHVEIYVGNQQTVSATLKKGVVIND